MRFGSPAWNPTASWCGPSRPSTSTSTRAAPWSKRTIWRSSLVRHERPVQPKYSASRRLVFPAPLRPWTTVNPAPSATSALAYVRKSRSRSRRTTMRRPLHVQPDRHDQVQEAGVVAGLDQPGPQRADQLQHNVIGGDRLQAVLEELRIEPDLEWFARERDGDRLRGL